MNSKAGQYFEAVVINESGKISSVRVRECHFKENACVANKAALSFNSKPVHSTNHYITNAFGFVPVCIGLPHAFRLRAANFIRGMFSLFVWMSLLLQSNSHSVCVPTSTDVFLPGNENWWSLLERSIEIYSRDLSASFSPTLTSTAFSVSLNNSRHDFEQNGFSFVPRSLIKVTMKTS